MQLLANARLVFIAPLLGSAVATYASWRVIYAIEAGMTMFGLVLAFFFVPREAEIGNPKMVDSDRVSTKKGIVQAFNPMNVFRQFLYGRVILSVRILFYSSFFLTNHSRTLHVGCLVTTSMVCLVLYDTS